MDWKWAYLVSYLRKYALPTFALANGFRPIWVGGGGWVGVAGGGGELPHGIGLEPSELTLLHADDTSDGMTLHSQTKSVLPSESDRAR